MRGFGYLIQLNKLPLNICYGLCVFGAAFHMAAIVRQACNVRPVAPCSSDGRALCSKICTSSANAANAAALKLTRKDS